MNALLASLPAPQPVFEFHIPADVHSGTLQHFLYVCRNHAERVGKTGKLTIKHRGDAALVLDRTPELQRIHTVRGDEFWVPRKTVANQDRRETERLARKRARRKTKGVWTQPCWTGEPRPTGKTITLDFTLDTACLEQYMQFRRAVAHCEEPLFIPRHASPAYRKQPRIRAKKFEPKPIPYDGEFSIRDITAEIGKHRWPDAMNRAIYDLFVTNETEPCPLSAAQIAERHGVHVRSLYTYSEKMRRQMPKRALTETIFVSNGGALNDI